MIPVIDFVILAIGATTIATVFHLATTKLLRLEVKSLQERNDRLANEISAWEEWELTAPNNQE